MKTYRDVVLEDNPLFYFECNESAGTSVSDSSGNGHTGQLQPNYSLSKAGMSGKTGNAIQFTGGRIEVPYFSGIKPTGDFTIEMMARRSTTPQFGGMLFGLFNSASPFTGPTVFAGYDQATGSDNPNLITFRQSSNVADAITIGGVGNAYNDNVYRHMVFIRRVLALEIYLDGNLVASKVLPNIKNPTDNSTLYIMGRSGLQQQQGLLDECAYYQSALDVERIKYHAAYAADKRMVSGNAKLDTGVAADVVAAHDWSTHALISQRSPASDGSFRIYVPAGQVSVTTYGPAGYQPVTHGPVDPVAAD